LRYLIAISLLSTGPVGAVTANPVSVAPIAPTLGLAEYLEQVQRANPEARAARDAIQVAELQMRQSSVPFSPELYADYTLFDNKAPPPNKFMPARTIGRNWDVGVRTKTVIGLDGKAYYSTSNSQLIGLSPQVPATTSYEQPQFGLSLTQHLWRDGFGGATRQQVAAQDATSRKALLDAKFKLKNLLLQAENTYWSLVSYGEIIRLQQENIDRARRLRDYMKTKLNQRLVDDVDFLQAQASLESRELEHRTSVDQRAVLARQFNTLRGAEGDQIDALSDLPKGDLLLKTARDPSKRMSREDFRAIFESARTLEGNARFAQGNIAPQLDLVGSVSTNGMDGKTSNAYQQSFTDKYPNLSIGVSFSIPLDYRLIRDMRRSYNVARQNAEDMMAQSEYSERRAWEDLVQQNHESQGRFEKAQSIETISTELVQRERQRLMDGRSTTFQTTTFETQLAGAQIARVQAQLDLVQKHNLIKQFEEHPR
jgi:outer membrane protein TolC